MASNTLSGTGGASGCPLPPLPAGESTASNDTCSVGSASSMADGEADAATAGDPSAAAVCLLEGAAREGDPAAAGLIAPLTPPRPVAIRPDRSVVTAEGVAAILVPVADMDELRCTGRGGGERTASTAGAAATGSSGGEAMRIAPSAAPLAATTAEGLKPSEAAAADADSGKGISEIAGGSSCGRASRGRSAASEALPPPASVPPTRAGAGECTPSPPVAAGVAAATTSEATALKSAAATNGDCCGGIASGVATKVAACEMPGDRRTTPLGDGKAGLVDSAGVPSGATAVEATARTPAATAAAAAAAAAGEGARGLTGEGGRAAGGGGGVRDEEGDKDTGELVAVACTCCAELAAAAAEEPADAAEAEPADDVSASCACATAACAAQAATACGACTDVPAVTCGWWAGGSPIRHSRLRESVSSTAARKAVSDGCELE